MCNTYFFSMATTATRTLLDITLYTHCLSCSLFETHQHLCRHMTWRHEVLGKNPVHRNNEINEAAPSLSSQLFVSAWNLTKLNKQGKCSQELVLAHNKALLGLTPRRMSNSCFHLRRSLEPSPILFIVRMEQWGKLQKQNCYVAAAQVGCFVKPPVNKYRHVNTSLRSEDKTRLWYRGMPLNTLNNAFCLLTAFFTT